MMGTLRFNNNTLQTFIRGTNGTSHSGTESSFVRVTEAKQEEVAIEENVYFDTTKMVSSGINETNYWTYFGDPTVPLRTAPPENISASHEDVIIL